MSKISEKKVKEIINDLKEFQNLNNSKHKATYYYVQKNNIVNSENLPVELIKEFLDIYSQVKRNVKTTDSVETDDRAITNVERDEDGLIQYYTFEIFRKDSPTLKGKLDRKEMDTIYRLYTIYGANLTQKIVSREFPEYTFIEFKRILRAFNIYKASSPFPQHMVEEKTEEELLNLYNQQKENNVLRRIEKDQLSEANKLVNKLAKENKELHNTLESINTIKVDLTGFTPSVKSISYNNEEEKSIVLFLSDMHIGAKCNSYTLYPNEWNEVELEKRLNSIVDKLSKLGRFYKIVLCMLGDNLDGMDNQTARRDHIMPQNMDNMEQVETFIRVMIPFIDKLYEQCDNLEIYSTKCGNHDGIVGYVSSLALKNLIDRYYKDIPFILFKDFIGSFKLFDHTYCICHGKDEQFMKRPMPVNLDERTKVMIYEWMENNKINTGSKTHFVKGDLHSNSLSSCNLFDYRNVLSLFGASDYSNFNYSRNAYGISYDLFINNVRTSGTFENL